MTAAGPPIGRWLAIVVVILAVVLVKPWSGSGPASPPTGRTAAVTAPSDARVAVTPSPAATAALMTAGPIASTCLDPPSWRITTVERWHDRTIRVWRAIDTVSAAAGPEDTRVPVTSLVSEGVLELGWCAPVVLPIHANGTAAVEVWRRTLDGASLVRVTSLRPTSEASPYGDLYGSPAAPRTTLWNDGTYVFLHRAPGGQESWFAVLLERRPELAAG